jgi:hypothetical protein
MFVTLVLYMGAERKSYIKALQHSSFGLVKHFSRGLLGPLGLTNSSAAGGV